jgi:hypothetical protein
MFTLTEAGQEYVAAHADELKASWDAVTGSVDDAEFDLRDTFKQVMVAVHQVSQAGSVADIVQAGKILADTRRALYRILAADGDDATGAAASTAATNTATAGNSEAGTQA